MREDIPFSIQENSAIDLNEIQSSNSLIDNNVETEFEGVDFTRFNPSRGEVEEEIEVDVLSSDDIINLILDSLEQDQTPLQIMGKDNLLDKALSDIERLIFRRTRYELDLADLFSTIPAVGAAIKLIACGFLCRPKFKNVITNPVKWVFLRDTNDINVKPNFFGQGLHFYKNMLAITTLDERILNKATNFMRPYNSLTDILKQCSHIKLSSPEEELPIDINIIRSLSAKDLADSVMRGSLSIGDLYRAGVNKQLIKSIKFIVESM